MDTEETEWTVEGFCAEVDRISANPPPAPEGFELVECTAGHWPTYMAHVDGMYPAPCPACIIDDYSKRESIARCKAKHRRWKSWRILGWLSSRAYSLGIIASCGTSYGHCEHCGIGRQHLRPRWRGKRSYILGVSTDDWGCLLKRHHRRTEARDCGLCSICCPCPDCGSTDPNHYVCGSN